MDQEHWRKVQQLFEAALEMPSAEIPSWLEEACRGDVALKAEVEELLHSDAAAGSFIRTAVEDDASRVQPRLSEASSDSSPSPSSKFGKYTIEARIGQGGFGVVYRGRDPVLGRHVALKTCSTEDGKLRRRFFREGRIAAGLQHPNVTTVHDLGVEEGVPYLVQEFLRGEDLDHLIERREPLPLLTKLDYLAQIARGLEYAHGAGVLHRDIKPGNVRVHESGAARQIKIMDFGIAKLLTDDTGLTGTGMTMGTVGYLAPEQMRGEQVDTRADIFSYGVLAYELLSYTRPFVGENFSQVSYQLLYVDPPPLTEAWPQCPPAIGAIVDRCLRKEPAERYMTFTEVLEDLEPELEALRTGPAALAPTLVLPAPSSAELLAEAETEALPKLSAKTGLTAAALCVVLGLAAIFGWRAFKSPEPGAVAGVAQAEPPTGEPVAASDATPVDEPAEPIPEAVRVTASGGERPPPEPAAPPPIRETSPEAPPTSARPAPAPPRLETDPEPSSERPPPTSRVTTPSQETSPARGSIDAPEPAAQAVRSPPIAPVPADDPPGSGPEPVDVGDPPAAVEPTPTPPAMQRGALLTPGPGVVVPYLLERPHPEYPERARRRRKEARVVVRVLVDENGRVLQAVAPAADRFGFGAAAKRAALKASFEPATRDGIAGKMWTELPFEFKLK